MSIRASGTWVHPAVLEDHDSFWFHWNQDVGYVCVCVCVCVCVNPALSITELIVVEAKGSSCREGV